MEPFRQKGSSMTSWSTFIFKSVCWKKVVLLNNIGETVIYLFFWNFLESFGKTVIIWNRNRNTVNLFIAICDQYNASLKKKKKILLTPNF